jgi:hypothetical protein
LFRPLEDAIRNKFIPAITGRYISDLERRMFALPYRFGRLAIRNPIITVEEEYAASRIITEELTKAIVNEQEDISSIESSVVELAKQNFKKNKEEKLKSSFDNTVKP